MTAVLYWPWHYAGSGIPVQRENSNSRTLRPNAIPKPLPGSRLRHEVTENVQLAEKIAGSVATCDGILTVQSVHIGSDTWRNELLLFVKPEAFSEKETGSIIRTIELVFVKLDEFNAHSDGIVIVGGKVLDQTETMSRHYGFINQLSRSASKMLDDDDRTKIAYALHLPSLDEVKLLGGHEYLAQNPDMDPFGLDELWLSKESIKMRSGFYVQSYDIGGDNVILVNGFHPAQLAHYTDPSHRIVLILLHSNTHWAVLRNEMVGATFPEKAVPGSIRGTLYAQPQRFGLESVSIANNGVHLSAGPYEGMFEIDNFFSKILRTDLKKQPPLMLQRMLAAGIDRECALSTLDNPIITGGKKPQDLFTATEDMDTAAAVAFWKENLPPS
jgi:nucleoside diphosphate kinase